MFRRLWRAILALFECSKEERWERLDRLAETNQPKYQDEVAKLSMKELIEYMDSEMYPLASGPASRLKREEMILVSTPSGINTDQAFYDAFNRDNTLEDYYRGMQADTRPAGAGQANQTNYHWEPGQEHKEPVKREPRRKPRPGVFDRPAMNRKERRKSDAVARRQSSQKAGKDVA